MEQYHLPIPMRTWVNVASVKKIQNFMRRMKMKDNFKNGFIIGTLFMLFMALIISCSYTPLEASGSSELGSSEWNPMYVKIVD